MGRLKAFMQQVGVYEYFVSIKRSHDRKQHAKLEKKNHRTRLEFYKRYITPKALVFDVGANLGNRSEIFIELGARVIAIEPQQSCVEYLNKKFGSSINIEQVGLGAKEGELDFFVADESTISTFSNEFINKTGSNKFKRNKWEKSIKVRVTTMDHLISKHGLPDFCKVDVEGFEPQVFAGLSKAIPILSFEYNVPDLAENVYSCLNKLNLLSPNYVFNFCIGETMKLAFEKWKNYPEFKKFVHSEEFLNTDFGDIYAQLT